MLNAYDGTVPAKCVDLVHESNLSQIWVEDIASPEPNRVAVVYRTSENGTDFSWKLSSLSF